MPVTPLFRNAMIRRFALSTALAAMVGAFTGCVQGPDEGAVAPVSDPKAGKTFSETPATPDNGLPRGCSFVWNDAAGDSVAYCADIRPSKPH